MSFSWRYHHYFCLFGNTDIVGPPIYQTQKFTKFIPGPLVVVIIGVLINKTFKFFIPNLYIDDRKSCTPGN